MSYPLDSIKHTVENAQADAFIAGVLWSRDMPWNAAYLPEDISQISKEAHSRYHVYRQFSDDHNWKVTLKDMANWTPEFPTDAFTDDNPFYCGGDENAPFFSEAYLYPLLGKEDARTLLYFFRAVFREMGVNLTEVAGRYI